MEISQTTLVILLVYSVVLGGATGIFYDICRIFRVAVGVRYTDRSYPRLQGLKLPILKRGLFHTPRRWVQTVVVAAGDLFTLLFAAIGMIILSYAYNSGRFRFFILLGLAVGFFIYRWTVGKIVMLIAEPSVILLKFCFLSFFIILGYPFAKFGYMVYKVVKKIISFYRFTLEKKKEKLYNIEEEVFFLEEEETSAQINSCDNGQKRMKWRKRDEEK